MSSQFDVCMLVRNTFVGDTRVIKEASRLAATGRRVQVLAYARDELPRDEQLGGFSIRRLGLPMPVVDPGLSALRELDASALRSIAGLVNVGKVTGSLAQSVLGRTSYGPLVLAALLEARPKVVHCHDLNTLAVGAAAARILGAKLVYDSHELWLDRNVPNRRPFRFYERRRDAILERTLIHRADAVITVSSTIAEVLLERYGIAKPELILNVPEETRPTAPVDLHAKLGRKGPILLYVGGVADGRGLMTAVEALPLLPEVTLAMMGARPSATYARLEARAKALGVDDRLAYVPAVPHHDVVDWTAGADVGLCTIEPCCLSYRLSLPNKLFQYAFAGVPMVASNLPEMARWVRDYRLGDLCEPDDPTDLARAVRAILSGSVPRMSEAEREAFRQRWCWQEEGTKLEQLYQRLDPR